MCSLRKPDRVCTDFVLAPAITPERALLFLGSVNFIYVKREVIFDYLKRNGITPKAVLAYIYTFMPAANETETSGGDSSSDYDPYKEYYGNLEPRQYE